MISRNRGFVNLAACTAIWVALWIVWSVPFVAAQSSWQTEWEKTLRAAAYTGASGKRCSSSPAQLHGVRDSQKMRAVG
jgi:hypothetical protein